MQAFADLKLVSHPADWKSICGYVFTISSGAVYFSSTKQRFFAYSIIEAKYIALSLASQQGIWTCHLVFSIEGTPRNLAVLLLFSDNKALLQLSKGIFNTSKIKYINKNFY